MRTAILAFIAVLATAGSAQARDCSGRGSDTVLSLNGWSISNDSKSQVEVTYRLDDDKPITLLEAHVYFQLGLDGVLADAPIDLRDSSGVRLSGVDTVTLSKHGARRLAKADHDSVTVIACTNYIEYLDGSGLIID